MKLANINESTYIQEQKTISAFKANIVAILLMAPVVLICSYIYTLFHTELGSLNLWVFLSGTLILIFLHEFVHGTVWGVFCEEKWKSIKFGFIWKALTPYCHCSEALTVNQYRLGSIAPLIFTGLAPFIISLISGSTGLMYASLLMIIGGGGDVYVLLMLRKEKQDALVIDHDSQVGYIVYRPS